LTIYILLYAIFHLTIRNSSTNYVFKIHRQQIATPSGSLSTPYLFW